MPKFVSISPESIIFSQNEFAARALPVPEDKDYNEFLELKADIEEHGILNPFSVREVGDKYCIIDGNRRATALTQLWAEGAPKTRDRYKDGFTVQVLEVDDIESLGLQIAANYNSKKQKAASLAKACYKMLLATNMTLEHLSKKVGITRTYLEQILKINALSDEIKASIDAGDITATNAIQLCKLPVDLLDAEVVDKAKLMTGTEFLNYVDEQTKAYKKAVREGKDPAAIDGTIVFSPKPKLRMKEELEGMYQVATDRAQTEPSEYNLGYAEALKYCFRMDESTLESDRAAFELSQKEKEDKKAHRAAERAAKKREDLLNFVKNDPSLLEQLKSSESN